MTTAPEPAPVSGCTGKAAYPTKAGALTALQRIQKRRAALRVYKRGERLHPYRCRHCGDWHLGAASV